MLARLWWKEGRTLGPAWLLLVGVAVGLESFLLSVRSQDVREGVLTTVAMIWAVLYAFAAGAAAFAGERESGTLGFLDALPVGRPVLWMGKVSFAMFSTFALALVLAGLAALGTTTRDPGERYGYGTILQVFGTLLFEGVAYGLLWSAFSKNPLPAGALAVLSVYGATLVGERFAPGHLLASNDLVAPGAIPVRAAMACAAIGLSALAVCIRPPSPSIPRSAARARRADPPRAIPVRRASATRSLDWQAFREGRATLAVLVAIVVLVPIAFRFAGFPSDGSIDWLFATLASLVAGVTVFGARAGSPTPRFLVQHGVAPGTAWGRRLWAWGLAMAAFLAVVLWICSLPGSFGPGRRPGPGLMEWDLLVLAMVPVDAFAVGVLCGMAIPRPITAAMVGVLGILLLVPAQVAAASAGMVPGWGLLLTPAILLGISRAWAGDWMAEMQGAGPWVRLGLLAVVPFGLLGASYIAYRAWGIRDAGPQYDLARLEGRPIPPVEDAAEAYRRAIAALSPASIAQQAASRLIAQQAESVINDGWETEQPSVISYWKENRAAIDLARNASAMPRARFEDVSKLPIDTPQGPVVPGLRSLGRLLALDARERLHRGDLPGAWDDILAQLRMAGQLAANMPTLTQSMVAAQVHHRGVGLAIDWAGHPGQTSAMLRAALADLRRLAPPPTAEAAIRVESLILDRTFGLPPEELDATLGSVAGGRSPNFARLLDPWWERERARRVCRRLVAGMLPEAAREPWQRPQVELFGPIPTGSPLARLMFPAFGAAVNAADREVVGRRALEQVLAIRAWQVDHAGEYPSTLEALVPAYLDRLPTDSYSGRPFGYVRSEGQRARPPILPDIGPDHELRPTRPGQPILYSVGPDGVDDWTKERVEARLKGVGDILFPLP